MSEEIKPNEVEPEFKYFIKLMFNPETQNYCFETNCPDLIMGYGLLEFGKSGMVNHIARLRQQQAKPIIQPKHGIMDFVRRKRI